MVLALFIGRVDLEACSCARILPACEEAWKADAVFVGTVAHRDPMTIFGFPLAWPFPTERRVRFVVKERFRGATDKTIEVTTGMGCCDCSVDFQRGRDYLVYAYRNSVNRVLYTGSCTRTRQAENAASDLAYLRSLASGVAPARVYGFITGSVWDIRFGEKATEPFAGVPLRLRSDTREWQTSTDAMGAYDFPALLAGTFSLSADLPRNLGGGEPRTVSLHEHGCSQQILLAVEQGQLSGRILEDGGQQTRTFVSLVPAVRGGTSGNAVSGFSAEDGAFTITHVAPGDYLLGVNISEPPREGHGLSAPWQPTYYPGVQNRALATQIHINSAQRLQGFEFRLPGRLKQRTITGVVKWPNGKPATAYVELKDNDFPGNVDLGNSHSDGTFTVTGVIDRPYNISAVVGISSGQTPMHSPKVDLGLSLNGPIQLVLSIPGRN